VSRGRMHRGRCRGRDTLGLGAAVDFGRFGPPRESGLGTLSALQLKPPCTFDGMDRESGTRSLSRQPETRRGARREERGPIGGVSNDAAAMLTIGTAIATLLAWSVPCRK
jgi:hypothetical protein